MKKENLYDPGADQGIFTNIWREMGDKTQILAMAFATRFPVRKVLVWYRNRSIF